MDLLLGTHHPDWLEKTAVPLFVSHQTLKLYKERLPVARGPWSLDSGGFTELCNWGRWRFTARQYVAAVRRYMEHVGNLLWAAPMDFMCEPPVTLMTSVINGRRMTVRDHQRLTVEGFLELKSLAPDIPFIPVLQAWWGQEEMFPNAPQGLYEDCIDAYARAGVKLQNYPLVGIGSVCRKQSTGLAFMLNLERQLQPLLDAGVRFHGFGFKKSGLRTSNAFNIFASIDSLAWSARARRNAAEAATDRGRRKNLQPNLCGRADAGHKSCANCLTWALMWRSELVAQIAAGEVQEDDEETKAVTTETRANDQEVLGRARNRQVPRV